MQRFDLSVTLSTLEYFLFIGHFKEICYFLVCHVLFFISSFFLTYCLHYYVCQYIDITSVSNLNPNVFPNKKLVTRCNVRKDCHGRIAMLDDDLYFDAYLDGLDSIAIL